MRGNHTSAAELALESGRSALEVGIPLFAAWALHEAFMFGHQVEAAGHLTEIANFSESLTISYFAAQASALECADPTALTHVATSFATRGELLFTALAKRQTAQLHHQRGKPTLTARATTAAQLFISVRTVDNHLATTYTKLGIHGRDELTSFLETP